MFRLDDKIALVTGATGGIGKSLVTALTGLGAHVVMTGTRQERLDALKAEIANVSAIQANLTDAEVIQDVVKKVVETHGRLDILVNNAGITRDGLAGRMSDQDWQDVIHVNLSACFFLMRAACRPMFKQRSGRIINIGSVVGLTGNPGQANYVAAKAGLVGLTKTLALEFAPRNITVNCVAPGLIETPMTDKLTEEQLATIRKRIPLGRIGAPQDVAACVAFLASDEAAYVSGQTIHVNGAMASP